MRVFRRIMLGGGIYIDALPDTQKIYYKATAKVTPMKNSLGASIIANKWDSTTGEGIIACTRDITMIDADAFKAVSTLTSVIIPDSVTFISSSAFYNCDLLTNIIVSEGNSVYDSRENCNAIIETATNELVIGCNSTIIPNSVTTIRIGAFSGCRSLTNITIPDSVTEIKGYAFSGCTSLTSVTIPDSVTFIRVATFEDCSSLTSVTIPDSVRNIESAAFDGCSSLKSIIIPESVGNIGSGTFRDCTSLISINIPKNVTDIGDSAFYNCSGRLTINSKIVEIDYTAANNPLNYWLRNSKFTELILGDNIEKIGNYVFHYYTSLRSITIPDSVTSIGNYAFYRCDSLTSVTIGSGVTSIGNYAFLGCKNLTSITIPNSVTVIGDSAFRECTSLTSIIIPNGVTSIEYNAFNNCTLMQYYDFSTHESVPTLKNTNAFNKISSTCKIIVPDDLYDEWIAATNWSTYASHIIKKSDWDASQTTE